VEPKKRRGGIIAFFRESWRELERVHWPLRKEVTDYTVACLLTCLVLALLIWGFDVGVSKLMSLIGLV
jgi:preprotein translocase subunit SecE